MSVPPHHFDDEPSENRPGGLLDDLERRQDDVLDRLDDLDAKLSEVLKGLEPAPASDSPPLPRPQADRIVDEPEDSIDIASEEDDFGSAEDWA